MLSRRLDPRTSKRGRSTPRRSQRVSSHIEMPALGQLASEPWQDAPTIQLRAISKPFQKKVVLTSSANEQIQPELTENADDAWLLDVKPSKQNVPQQEPPLHDTTTSTPMKTSTATFPAAEDERETANGQGKPLQTSARAEILGPGHRLWPVVLHLSERIWQDLNEGSVPGDSAPGVSPAKIAFVRKRSLDILRAKPALAKQVQSVVEAEQVLKIVVDEVLGYGPLEALLNDERVTEITVVGPRFISAERDGEVRETAYAFANERHMLRIIKNILHRSGQIIDTGWPLADIHLPDGSLVNVILPPSAINGPVITFRKRPKKLLNLTDLIQNSCLTQEMADFLAACVKARLNILICGSMNSGRTTLLNALSACISEEDRIVTIEDVPELQLSQKHVISLVSQVKNTANSAWITTRDLVMHALRMRAERIIVGECRGDETLELFRAMYAGQDGLLTTMYANNLRECLARLETLNTSKEMKVAVSAIRTQIASSLDVIIHVTRGSNGLYKILNIAEVQGVENDVIRIQSIFYYSDTVTDTFEASGFCPTLLAKIEARGISLPREMFVPRRAQLRK